LLHAAGTRPIPLCGASGARRNEGFIVTHPCPHAYLFAQRYFVFGRAGLIVPMGERSSGMTGQPPTPDQPLPGFMLQGLIGEGGIGLDLLAQAKHGAGR
jgi:hypothetical protein